MTCRLRFITSTGALLPAEASDVIGLDADTIEKARLSFNCPYCTENHMVAIEIPAEPPYSFSCNACGNEYDLLEGADGEGKREAVDLLNIQNVIKDKQAVARLARNHHSPLFSLVAFGATQYGSGALLVVAFALFGSAFFLYGTTAGTLVSVGAIVSLLTAVGLTSAVSARARQAMAGTGVNVSGVDAIWRYRDIYRHVRARRVQEAKDEDREMDVTVEE